MVNKWKDKEFMKKYQKKWRGENKEKIKEQRKIYDKIYYQKNKEKIKNYNFKSEVKEKRRVYNKRYYSKPEVKVRSKIYMRKWYQENKEKRKAYDQTSKRKEYKKKYRQRPEIKLKRKEYAKRPDIKEKRKAYQQTLEYKKMKNEYQKKRRKIDSGFSTIGNIQAMIYIALQKYSKTGKIMSTKKYGIDIKAIVESLGDKPEDGNEYEKDHIIPLSWFNLNNFKEIKWAFAPENWQWLRKELNRWKSDRFILPLAIEEQDILIKQNIL